MPSRLLIYGIPHCTGGERDRCKTPIEVSTPKTKIWTNLKNTETGKRTADYLDQNFGITFPESTFPFGACVKGKLGGGER